MAQEKANQGMAGETETVRTPPEDDLAVNPESLRAMSDQTRQSLSAQQIREAVKVKKVFVVYAALLNMRTAFVGEETTFLDFDYSDERESRSETRKREKVTATEITPTVIVAAFNNEIARDNFITAVAKQERHYHRYLQFLPGELEIT